MIDAATERFIEQAGQLPPAMLADVFDRSVTSWQSGGREASRATKPSAAEDSTLDHAVRSTLLPRADELNRYRVGLHSDAKSATVIAARAILKRSKLSVEHYEVLVEPFIAAGVEVPSHPGVIHTRSTPVE
ncbi:hypothetical protein V6U90_29935 [Micromonospora sp. CPCC 206060]|uniref:hypothetical protein n=1 Tax=Micromonospora sp. CPCC 206060 TaxID=3122406 RepID=UPI002FF35F6C